jgi:hypothetical protein
MRKIALLFLCATCALTSLSAQEKALDTKDIKTMEKKKDDKEGWTKIGGLGANFSWLSLINPRAGSGDNRIGFGGLLNYSANYIQGKVISNNKFGLQLDVVKIGEGPYTKANDVLQLTSQTGYQIDKKGKWYFAGLADFQSQFLPTYGPNYLQAKQTINGKDSTLSLTGRLFSPATFKLAPGFIHKPNAQMTILYSPVAFKAIIVADKALAQTGKFFPQNDAKDKTVDAQVGSELRIDYGNKFFNDRLIYTTTLDLYSNYLRNPQNIDVEWYHSIDVMVSKNISLNFKTDWFYDDDIQVFTDGDAKKPTKNVFYRNAFLLKFSRLF